MATFQCGDCLRDIEVAHPVPRAGTMACPTPECEGGIDFTHAYRHAAEAWDNELDYDVEEMSVLTRMKHVMKTKHGYEDADFEDATFMDIESMFLDSCGEPDFR